MKILGTGLAGLVGSRIVELLSEKYEFDSSNVDITDRENIQNKIKNSDASLVLHLAAKTNVDSCEQDKSLGENGEAWKINVLGTQNIVDACWESNKKLIYISTDFVFDGEHQPEGGYSEEDKPNPINWYAKTKYGGELIVQKLSNSLILRIAYPYRASYERLDFVRAILNRFKEKLDVTAIVDHVFTPTFIDDIAVALDVLIKNDSKGLFHVAGGRALTPFDAAGYIAKIFGFDQSKISKTTRAFFFKDRAQRPFQVALKNDKIEKLGIKMRTFEEGVKEIKSQMFHY